MIVRLSFCVLVFVVASSFSSLARSEIPQAYLGTWQIDLIRTFKVHFQDLAESHPEIASGIDLDSVEETLSREAVRPGAEVLMTITADTITARQENSGHDEQVPYRLIEESSEQITVELSPSEGDPTISVIRLVEGGLAFSEDKSSADDSEKPNSAAGERMVNPSQPKWFYLKRRE